VTHSFKPVTTGEAIQVAILDELQQIKSLLEPSPEPAELPRDEPAEVQAEKPAAMAPAKKAASKTTRKTVTGR